MKTQSSTSASATLNLAERTFRQHRSQVPEVLQEESVPTVTPVEGFLKGQLPLGGTPPTVRCRVGGRETKQKAETGKTPAKGPSQVRSFLPTGR